MIDVLIVDDSATIRRALTAVLTTTDDIRVVGEAINGLVAVEEAIAKRPDVILMDINMPIMNGIQATAAICGRPALANTHVLVFTSEEDDQTMLAALTAGASGILAKHTDPAEITEAIRTAVKGDALISPRDTMALLSRQIPQPPHGTTIAPPPG